MTEFEKWELSRKVGLFGLDDLRKLAPIGDLGYENGWYSPYIGVNNMWLDVMLPRLIMKSFREQRERMGYVVDGYSTGWAGTDHHSYCKSLSLYWHCDSSG